MKTIIFDIDGTLTTMWPIEKSVLLVMLKKRFAMEIERLHRSGIKETYKIFSIVSKTKIGKMKYRKQYDTSFMILKRKKLLPQIEEYPIVQWIKKNEKNYHFIYATGGQTLETLYVLESLNIDSIFDLRNSISKSNYPFSKSTGLPFKHIKAKFPNCALVTDSESDCNGAIRAGMPFIKIKPKQRCCVPIVMSIK